VPWVRTLTSEQRTLLYATLDAAHSSSRPLPNASSYKPPFDPMIAGMQLRREPASEDDEDLYKDGLTKDRRKALTAVFG
jgi:hypothetical protein